MKKKNEIAVKKLFDSDFPLNIPIGTGKFDRGTDGRGNPYEKRTYDNGDFLKQELLHSGEIKITAKKKLK